MFRHRIREYLGYGKFSASDWGLILKTFYNQTRIYRLILPFIDLTVFCQGFSVII